MPRCRSRHRWSVISQRQLGQKDTGPACNELPGRKHGLCQESGGLALPRDATAAPSCSIANPATPDHCDINTSFKLPSPRQPYTANMALNPSHHPSYAAEFGGPSRTKKLGFGTRPALLLDICDAYFSPSSPLHLPPATLASVITTLTTLLTAARTTNTPIIYAQTLYTRPSSQTPASPRSNSPLQSPNSSTPPRSSPNPFRRGILRPPPPAKRPPTEQEIPLPLLRDEPRDAAGGNGRGYRRDSGILDERECACRGAGCDAGGVSADGGGWGVYGSGKGDALGEFDGCCGEVWGCG